MINKLNLLILVTFLLCIPSIKANAQTVDNYKIISFGKDNYNLEYEFISNTTNENNLVVGETLNNYVIRGIVHIDDRFISSYSTWDNLDYVIKDGWQEVTISTKTPIYGQFKVVLSIYGEKLSSQTKAPAKITPIEEVSNPILSVYAITLDTGMTYDLNVDNVDTANSVEWESTNTKVVEVDKSSGVITAIKKGNAIIKCRIITSSNVEEILEVNVNVGYSDSTPILTAKNLDLKKDEKFNIDVQNKISKSTYLWTSSDKALVRIHTTSGVVKAISNGETYVYCTITTPSKEIILLKCDIAIN